MAAGLSPRRLSTVSVAETEAAAASHEQQQHDSLLSILEQAPGEISNSSAAAASQAELLGILGRCLGAKSCLRTDGCVSAPIAWQRLLGSCAVRANLAPSTNPAIGDDIVGGAMVINVCGRLLSGILSPQLLAGMSLSACRVALVLDGTATESSVRREVRFAANASSEGLASVASDGIAPADIGCKGWDASDPWVVAALFATCGVGTTVHTPWPASHVAQELLLVGVITRAVCAAPGTSLMPIAEAVRTTMFRGGAPLVASSLVADASRHEHPANRRGSLTDLPLPLISRPVKLLKNRVKFNAVVFGLPQTALLPV